MQQPRPRWLMPTFWALTVVAAGAIGAVAARTAVQPPAIDSSPAAVTTIAVQQASVGERTPHGATVEWPASITHLSGATGTVTSINLAPATPVRSGDTPITVDLRPVVVAKGAVPMFRSLTPGAHGADVRQLRGFLAEHGHAINPGDHFDEDTARAVKAWQQAAGLEPSGTVEVGELMFLPGLPTPLALAPDVGVGTRISPGQPLFQGAAASPTVFIVLAPELVSRAPVGTTVVVDVDGSPREFQVSRIEQLPDTGQAKAYLLGPDGAAVCTGEECGALVPLGGSRMLPAEIVTVPEQDGPAVPTAAIQTQPDGQTTVTLDSGETVVVRVLASADGLSVVEGVSVGQRVRIADEPAK